MESNKENGEVVVLHTNNTYYFQLPNDDEIIEMINNELETKYGEIFPGLDCVINKTGKPANTKAGDPEVVLLQTKYVGKTLNPTQPWVYSSTGGTINYRKAGGPSVGVSVSFTDAFSLSFSIPTGEVGDYLEYSFNFPANRYCKLRVIKTYECKEYQITWYEPGTGIQHIDKYANSAFYSLQGIIYYQ